MNRIAVTGSIAYDYISTYDQPFEDVLLPGKLDRLSVCFFVLKKERHFGGTAGNIAYNLGLLSESPEMIGAVGHDFSDYEKWLNSLGVNMDYVGRSQDFSTATATIISDPNGHQISEFYPGAMTFGEPIDVLHPFKVAEFVIIAPDDPKRIMQYVRTAKSVKTPYFFDPGQNLPVLSAGDLLEGLTGSEGVFVNEYELNILTEKIGLSPLDLLKKTKLLVVTRGAQGSQLLTLNDAGSISTIDIPIVVPEIVTDPTGCGDAYRAGFLKGYVEGRDLEVCGKMGALLAMYNVEKVGTQNHSVDWKGFSERYQRAFSASL